MYAVAADDLFWHGFEDEFLVFNQQTGHTHLLHPLGAALLQALQDAGKSLDTESLEQQFRHYAGEVGDGISRAMIESALEDLTRLGLTTLESA